MIDREDIVFATCYQLAGLISSDWEDPPEEIIQALEALRPIDEPGEAFNGTPVIGNDPFKLTPSEKEPESIRLGRRLIELRIVANILKVVMKYSDAWSTPDSDTIQKEIIARITNYEDDIKRLTTPEPFTCNIVL